MLDRTHSYTAQGSYKVRISNIKDFLPVISIQNLNLDIANISKALEEAKWNMWLLVISHILLTHPGMNIDEVLDLFDEVYEESYKETALDTYIFNKYAQIPITEYKNSFNTTKVGSYAFLNMTHLKKFDFSKILSIGTNAFTGCTMLGYIENLTSYSQYSIEFSNSLTSISECAFNDCNSLRSIYIPKSVKSIDYAAFGNCKNLHLIVFGGRTSEEALYDFSNIFYTENETLKTNITSTKGYLVFESSTLAEDFSNLIAELDETYPIQETNELNTSEASPYDDTPPCPAKQNAISITSADAYKINDGICPTGNCYYSMWYDNMPNKNSRINEKIYCICSDEDGNIKEHDMSMFRSVQSGLEINPDCYDVCNKHNENLVRKETRTITDPGGYMMCSAALPPNGYNNDGPEVEQEDGSILVPNTLKDKLRSIVNNNVNTKTMYSK